MTRVLLEDLLPDAHSCISEDTWDNLSDHEKEVLKLVAFGHTGAEIAINSL
jgi:DNA-binding CsgD family transcriptional regulator